MPQCAYCVKDNEADDRKSAPYMDYFNNFFQSFVCRNEWGQLGTEEWNSMTMGIHQKIAADRHADKKKVKQPMSASCQALLPGLQRFW